MFECANVPKNVGVLIVGLAGNNGSTFWALSKMPHEPIFGSIVSCADIPIEENGTCFGAKQVNISSKLQNLNMFSKIQDIRAISGWDANGLSLIEALNSNQILDRQTISQLALRHPEMYTPISRGIVYPSFVGIDVKSNTTGCVSKDIEKIRADIDIFAIKNDLDLVIVMYSGSTERYPHNPPDNLFHDFIANNLHQEYEISPSQIYALATVFADVETCFVNCAAQNTIVPFIEDKFKTFGRMAIGNDLCTGQTRLKASLLGTFLGHGMPIETIVNFNTLGNNDGLNLLRSDTNYSKTQSKCAMVSGAMQSSPTLYPRCPIEQVVNISYLKSVGDNKRAMDEYRLRLPFNYTLDMFINSICPDTALALGVLFDIICAVTLISGTTYKKHPTDIGKLISSKKANALVACLFKNCVSDKARFSLHENRDVLTGFLLEVCGEKPETFRHHRIFK